MADTTAPSFKSDKAHSSFWWLKWFFGHLFFGDQEWGWVRLGLTVLLVLGLAILALFFQWNYLDPFLGGQASIPSHPIWVIIWKAARYIIAPFAAILLALYISSRYVQDIYEISSLKQAFQFIFASLFGVGYPKLIIEDGRKLVDPGKTNLIDTIGGPGFITVRPGNVVLLEYLKGPSNVISSGTHFISRFERVKDIASLQDQQMTVDKITAVTKDGIEVTVRNISYRYRLLRDRRQTGTDPRQPYPFSVQGVRNMAYGRRVSKEGLVPWHSAVQGTVTSGIADYISQHQYDQLTAPTEGDPRADIIRQIYSKNTRRRLKEIGAELVWIDIGHFDNTSAEDQRFAGWKIKWQGNAKLSQAQGEAQRLAYQEMGRAEAQSEMLMSVMHVFEDIPLTGSSTERLRNIFLARTAQVLESMVTPPELSSGSEKPSPSMPGQSDHPEGPKP